MKIKLLLISTLLLTLNIAFGQKKISGTIRGILTDTAYRETMADATVSVLHNIATDSTVLAYTRADEKGAFLIKNLSEGAYRLVVSFQGYTPLTRKFTVSAATPDVNLGSLNMNKASDMLEEVIVERPPITIKGDTVEFAASAFKTKPNAVAEDLLKKLPGVEVDKDGNVTAQGETIQKIYVNGKEFFGSDPKMATKNITADMIESVQVFDDMSEQAKFTRIDDGSRSKTINIKLKKGMDKGYFGRGNVSYGTSDRYSGNLMLNKFQGDRRISIIGSSNNINKQGFSARDVIGNMGGFGGGGGGGGGRRGGGGGGNNGGLTKATNAGVNYSDNFGKVSFTGSYMYGTTTNKTYQTSYNKYELQGKDSISYETDTSSSYNNNQNHDFNLKLEYDIDSMNSLIYTPNFTIQNSNDNSVDTSFIRAVKPDVDYISRSQISKRNNERNGITLNNELLFRHRFKKFGRTFTLGYRNEINNSKGSGYTFSPLSYYDETTSQLDSMRHQDFLSSQTTRSNSNVISSSYTEPIGTNKILEFNYAYTNRNNTSDRSALSYRDKTKQYDSLNKDQTNYFDNGFIAHRVGLNFRYKTKLYGFQIGGAMQASQLDNSSIRAADQILIGKDSVLNTKQNYVNFFPTANFNYDFSRRKNIQVRYTGRTNQPTVKQLQNVRDVTNNLRTVAGNPDLKQEFSNKLNISYKTFNETTFRYLNANINYEQTSNKIVNGTSYDTGRGSGVLLIKPLNLNGTYNGSYDISVGVPLREGMKGSSINLGNRGGYSRNVSFQLGNITYTKTFTMSQSAGINLDIKEKLNMEFKGRFSYNAVSYDSRDASRVSAPTVRYFSQNYSTDINYFITPSLILSTDFDYAINSGLASGYNTSIPIWNGGIAHQVFKKRNGEIKLTVNDLLNQNKSIERTIQELNIYDSRTVILQRYFLLTFTYSFNQFGKKGQRGNREMRMPGEEGEWRRGGGGFGGGRRNGGGF